MATANDLLDGLESDHELTPRWDAGRNRWIKRILPIAKGRVGENLLDRLCEQAGVEVEGKNGPGHDRCCGGVKVEVKLSTFYDSDDPDQCGYKWLQLRPDDDYDVVALIAIDPDDVHVWLVDKATILDHAQGQHGGKSAQETRMVSLGEHDRPDWLGPDLADDPAAFAEALRRHRP